MSQYAHLSKPDAEVTQFLETFSKVPHAPTTDVFALRKHFDTMAENRKGSQVPVEYPSSVLKVTDVKIPVPDGPSEIGLRLYVPQRNTEKGEEEGYLFPLLVWAHGGGFCVGGLAQDDEQLKAIAIDHRLSIVSIDYRLAPEFPFPVGLNDSYAAMKWAAKNSKEALQADPAKGFLVGGASSGGNFAAVLAHLQRDDITFAPKLTGQVLQIPTVVHPEAIPVKYKDEILSYEQNKDAPILNAAMIKLIIEAYAPPDVSDPRLSPLLFPSHTDLPPALIQVAGLDPLRDEAIVYEHVLSEAGVPTKLFVYPGLPHGFHGIPQLSASKKWKQDFAEGLQWLLKNPAISS